jgi:hypothetical protein
VHVRPRRLKTAARCRETAERWLCYISRPCAFAGKDDRKSDIVRDALYSLFRPAAHAETWYLMAADEKLMSEPGMATRMSRGSTILLTSHAELPSREKCESARPSLIDDWRRRRSVITRGSWNRHGFN